MAEERQLTVTLALNSSSMQKQIQSINADTKQLKSEFENAGAGIKDFEKSNEGANAKLKLLEGTLENTRKKLDVYNQKLKDSKSTLDKATEGYKTAGDKVNLLKDKLAEAEKTFGKTSDEAKELREELKKAEKSFDSKREAVVNANNKLKDINTTINRTEAECKNLESQISEVNTELDNIDGSNINNLESSFRDTQTTSKDFMGTLTLVGQGITDLGEKAKDTGVKILTMLASSVQDGAELEVENNAISTMLGDQEQAVRDWASTYAGELGLTEHQLTLVTGKNMLLAEKMGLTGESAKDMAQNMSVVTQDLATFYDVDPTEMVTKFNSALNGSKSVASYL